MNTLHNASSFLKVFYNLKSKTGRNRAIGSIVAIMAVIIAINALSNKVEVPETTASVAEVTVLSVGELASDARFDTIGKVEAVSQANLQSESGGRVTSVSVKVGDSVAADQVIATIDNKLQKAALTQAQGSYEAALAAAAVGDVTANQAATALDVTKNGAVSTFKNAFNTINGAFNNTIDDFYSLSNVSIIGLKIDGFGNTELLNRERTAFKSILSEWQQRASVINQNSNLETELAYAGAQVDRTIAIVDIFINIFNRETTLGGYSEAELQIFSLDFTTLRATLIATRSAINNAETALRNAKDGVEAASLAASGGKVSTAGAQVKIAFGALQTAQASYEKTLVRTPINGVVNALYLKTGDYTAPSQPAAIIANNNGLQIKTFVSQADGALLKVGDPVTIEGSSAGVITAKAGALDPTNGKVAIIVGVNEGSTLTNGATVKVTFSQLSSSTETESEKLLIPLTALKITSDGSFVFEVSEDETLKAVDVEQGKLFGENIDILSGITKESRIVTDARGLKDGQKVTLKK
jgi:multidrug efflux pump subunit AcrA (membrane-fusion protein)